jgi:hypothetical protein
MKKYVKPSLKGLGLLRVVTKLSTVYIPGPCGGPNQAPCID